MSINSRLRNFEKSLKGRERALLWLKTARGRGKFSEYWKWGEFQPWVSESEEAGLLYHLVFHVNGGVLTAAQSWHSLASMAGVLGICMMATPSSLETLERNFEGKFLELWRQKLCALLGEVATLERAVELISDGHLDGHEILFADVREKLTSCCENAKLLAVGYNYFAAENGKVSIDMDEIERGTVQGVDQLLNEWVMLSRSYALMAGGRVFESRDEVLRLLNANHSQAE